MKTREEKYGTKPLSRIAWALDKLQQRSGNTNDGNTATRYFYNAACSAEITGVTEMLIKWLYVILQAISSGIMMNSRKICEYALENARKHVSTYDWYYMASFVYKYRFTEKVYHFAMLPIGQLLRDAQESCNKDLLQMKMYLTR